MKKLKIAFVCTHNSCRSIMAEGFLRELGENKFIVYSAGTEENSKPKPLALEVMEDIGINMDFASSKLLDTLPNDLDILITMGCGVACPSTPSKYREDFGIDDPSGGPKSDFVKTRNIVEAKVKDLIRRLNSNEFDYLK